MRVWRFKEEVPVLRRREKGKGGVGPWREEEEGKGESRGMERWRVWIWERERKGRRLGGGRGVEVGRISGWENRMRRLRESERAEGREGVRC